MKALFKQCVKRILPAERIAYIHLPKCGGTSVNTALLQLYRHWRMVSPQAVVQFGEFEARNASAFTGVDDADFRRALFAYCITNPKSRLLTGHFRFCAEAYESVSDKWCLITVLRHPVERWLSHYYFNLNSGTEYNIDLPIEAFLKTDRARALGAIYVDHFSEGRGDPDTAIDALKQFDIVGCLENLGRFKTDFKNRFGKDISVESLNVGTKKNVTPTIRAAVEDCCRPDMQVYRTIFND